MIKAELKVATRVNTSNLAAKPNLASLKSEVDKIDADKPKTDCYAKISDIEIKHYTDYNKFMNEILDAKIKEISW